MQSVGGTKGNILIILIEENSVNLKHHPYFQIGKIWSGHTSLKLI